MFKRTMSEEFAELRKELCFALAEEKAKYENLEKKLDASVKHIIEVCHKSDRLVLAEALMTKFPGLAPESFFVEKR